MNPDNQGNNNTQQPEMATPQPMQPMQTPTQPMQPPSANNTYETGEDAKVSSPKYLLIVYGVLAAYILLDVVKTLLNIPIIYIVISILVPLVWLIGVILGYRTITNLKSSGNDSLSKKDKKTMVLFMSIAPIATQAFYYYRLKKILPQTSRISLKIGWKVFLLQLIPSIFFFLLFAFLLVGSGVQKSAWYNNYSTKFTSQAQAISNDIGSIALDAQNQNSSALQNDCQTLRTDVSNLRQIPAYPVQSTASKISQGENYLSSGATDCLNGTSQQSTSLINQAASSFNIGLNDLNSVHKAVTTN